jgi:queuine/archaeosine tRNA-ribosyltransferase
LRSAESVPDERRQELLTLVGTLRNEINELSKTDQEQAQSIAGFTQVSTHEATRNEPNPDLVKVSLEGLSGSVVGFEKSHPRLVQIVNSISTTLSNLGI